MAAGLQIFSQNGDVLQIDSDYRNLVFDGSFTVAIPAAPSGLSSTIVNVDADRLYAYRTESPDGVVVAMYPQAGRLVFVGGYSAATVRVYRFRKDGGAPAGNSGLEVFDPAGSLVFSSNFKYLRVLDFIAYSSFSMTGAAFSRSYPVRPAVLIGTLGASGRISNRGDGMWLWLQRFSTFHFNANSLAFSPTGIAASDEGEGSHGYSDYQSNASSALVIDVSGL